MKSPDSSTDSHASERGKPLILLAVCMAAIVLPLSFTGGAVSTPAIGRELGGSAVSLTWITNAFMLSFGSLLMAAGALADVYGRKRLFAIGIGFFVLTSLALAAAPSVAWLDILRAVQGIAAAAALSGGTAALAQEFDGHARTRAFSMLGTSFGIGLAFGPLLGGVLIDAFGWRSVFLSTALVGAAAMLFGVPRMRETRDPNAQGLDWPGTISFTATLVLFTFAVIQAPESGWSSALVAGSLAAAALTLAIFIYVESCSARPMLDLRLFRIPRFVGVQMLPIGTCYSYIVLVVMLPLRFIGIEGMSEIDAGILMIALSAPMLVVPVLVATLTRWVSAGVLSGIGFLIAAVGLHWFSQIDVGAAGFAVVGPMLLIGIGAGMPWGLMDGLAVSVVPKERAGMATGIFNTTRVAGEGIALATVSAVLAAIAQVSLSAVLAEAGSTAGKVGEAAQRLATGDLAHAAEALPQVSHQLLVAGYGDAFRMLLHVLTVITVLSAVAVFGFLSRTPEEASALATEELGSNA
ncbi:MFS transporter [Cupriavidus sp. M-11]|uniref:MFS transporter n=1 Tax=Cupriavidus sp. M-11 TaxID=3233038 RepID=UPI003F91BD65